MLRVITFTAQGKALAERIAEGMPAVIYTKYHTDRDSAGYVAEPLAAWAKEGFLAGDALLFIGAAGIAVRAIAGCIKDKLSDVPVLVMDMQGSHVIPILSGHYGGANELALELAGLTGAVPVITTATDQTGTFAADLYAKKLRMRIRNPKSLPYISGKSVAGDRLCMFVDPRSGISVPEGVEECGEEKDADIVVTLRPLSKNELMSTDILYLTPVRIHAGIGCKRNAAPEQVEEYLLHMLKEKDLDIHTLADIASIDRKKEEPAICRLSEKLDLPFITYTAEELREVQGEFPESPFVEQTVGVGNVASRAAARAAGQGYRMLMYNAAESGVTLAFAVETLRNSNRKILRFV